MRHIPLVTILFVAHVGAASRRQAPSPKEWLRSLASSVPATGPFVFDPVSFGGDPSGVNDSSTAVQAAIQAALDASFPGSFIGNGTNHGGATVDLGGGMFTLHKGLWLSGGGGGVRICCGALRAGPDFPSDAFLITISKGDTITEDTTFEDLQLDSAQRGGGIHTSDALRVHVSRCYFHGFSSFGLLVNDGHEVHLSDSFLGEFWWAEGDRDDGDCHASDCSGTAVAIQGNDHWISDVIVFSGRIGIEVDGAAGIITNTHIYNGGEASLVVKAGSTRVIGCYFDFTPVWLYDPVGVDLTHSFFLGAVGVQIRSSGEGVIVSGLQITHNQFVVGSADPSGICGITVNETAGAFSAVNDTTIAGNVYPPATYGDSRGASMLRRATEWTMTATADDNGARFDFSGVFAFDCVRFPVVSARHDVVLPAGSTGFPRTALRLGVTKSCELVVESDSSIAGALITVTARQAQ